MRRSLWPLGLAALAAAAGAARADEPATVTVAKEAVDFTVDLTGAFDAKSPVEVSCAMQQWGDELEVEEASPGGAVEKGATLVRFKTEKVDEQLKTADRDLAIARAALAVQTEEQKRRAESSAIALVSAEKAAKDAADALSTFEKVEMQLRIDQSAYWLEGTRNWIQDQSEELAQLEKMYKADELTEATEEIVLNRTRRDLDRSKRSLGFQVLRDGLLREIEIPRDHEALKLNARRTVAERDRLRAVTELQQAQARLDLEKAQAGLENQERNFGKLTADREKFVLTAPEAGLAVPGALSRGKWTNADDVTRQLRKGGKLRGKDVIFTIVHPGDVRVVTSVHEPMLLQVKAGQDAQVVCAAGDATLAAKVATVTTWASGGDFAVTLDLSAPDSRIQPGWTCKLRIATGTRDAILVPSAAIEDAGFEKFAHVVGADGKPQKRAVRLGASKGDKVEVVSGLADGEKVLATAPKK